MKVAISFIFFLVLINLASAQDNLLSSFRAVQADDGIQLFFTIRAGNQCNDLEIQRSEDSLVFTEIGIIPGVCGSSSSDESYEFSDNNPLINKEAFYRLNLRNSGFSYAIKIKYISYNDAGYLIYPNPFIDKTNIYFKNEKKSLFIIYIYDSFGRIIYKDFSKANLITLERNEIDAGIYYFILLKEDQLFANGSLVIL